MRIEFANRSEPKCGVRLPLVWLLPEIALAASNAGYQNTYGSYAGTASARAYGPGGSAYATAYGSGTYSQTTYNAAAAQQAQALANDRNQALFDRQQANAEFAKQDLQARALKANTLSPGEFVMGDVVFELPKRNKKVPAQVEISVDVAGTPVRILLRERQ
ncbi:hypothetical protein H1235_02020 [Pseudoxanthomonas sp. NC8]|nr:hypothetical protein H1235_02020 [Pseudoxanthomonas sp. NC8]